MTYCPRCTDQYGVHNVRLLRDWPDEPLYCLCGFRDEPVSTEILSRRVTHAGKRL